MPAHSIWYPQVDHEDFGPAVLQNLSPHRWSLLLFLVWITTGKGVARSVADHDAVNDATRQSTLYQFRT